MLCVAFACVLLFAAVISAAGSFVEAETEYTELSEAAVRGFQSKTDQISIEAVDQTMIAEEAHALYEYLEYLGYLDYLE